MAEIKSKEFDKMSKEEREAYFTKYKKEWLASRNKG